jgi:hypothetical protein
MKLWITRTSRESCMITTKPPAIEPVDGSDRMKAFVAYGDPIGTKNLCMVGILKLMPDLKLDVLESKPVEITASEFVPGGKNQRGVGMKEAADICNKIFAGEIDTPITFLMGPHGVEMHPAFVSVQSSTLVGDGTGEALPEIVSENQWIRVEDAMPDDDMEVMVYTDSGLMFLASHDSDVGGWKESCVSMPLIIGVTHWMDLIPPTSSLQPQA